MGKADCCNSLQLAPYGTLKLESPWQSILPSTFLNGREQEWVAAHGPAQSIDRESGVHPPTSLAWRPFAHAHAHACVAFTLTT